MNTYYTLSDNFIIKGFPNQGLYKAYNCYNGLIFNLHPDFYRFLKSYYINPVHDYDEIFNSDLGKALFRQVTDKEKINITIDEYYSHYIECVMLHLLEECNNYCRHCYVNAEYTDKERVIKIESLNNILCKLKEYGVFSINLSGGELGIVKNLDEVLSTIVDYGFYLQGLFTNGTLMQHIDTVYKLNQKTTVYISLDGWDSIIHDDFRRHRGSFAKAIDLINALKNNSGHKIAINTILHKKNNDPKRLYELIRTIDPYSWRIETPFSTNRWFESSKYALTADETIDAYISMIEMWLKDGEPFELEIGQIFRSQSSKFGLKKYDENESVCSYFSNMLGIYANGDVTHCPAVNRTLSFGNIFEDSLSNIINKSKFLEYKNARLGNIIKDEKFKECQTCDILSICALGCRANVYNSTGDYWGFDTYTCHQMKEGIKRLNQILKGTKHEYI